MTSEQIYVGSYTTQEGGGEGIGFGTADELQVVAASADPSFLTISADGRFLYATNELEAGRVSAFAIADSGALEFLNHQPTGGAHPCHLEIDPTGKFLLSANYSSGSVAIHPIKDNGSLGDPSQILQREGTGPNPDRQEGPHAHQVTFDPSGSFAFDIDLGTDSVYVSTLSADGRLAEVSRLQVHPGAGPRHLVFHPGGHAAYLVNELDSTLTVLSHSEGKLAVVESVSTRPDDAEGESFPAEVLVAPDGRFVYSSNRGDDTIAVFETGAEGLEAELIQTIGSGGTWPRHLAFSKDGTELYAANERSNTIAVFTVDQSSGALTATGTPLDWPKPVCVLPY
ncbi:lactonase family protein [Kribbella sp. NPDC056861]|uniref:lactonase family protein n=1 Tax=Kribbella sp. NPDC056861 TaxID=3154857 RepID=UPI003447C74D